MTTRRGFLAQSLALASAPAIFGQSAKLGWRVGVIGHTGRGNYGHGLDVVWNLLKEARIGAVADAHDGGLAKAGKKLKVEKGYEDYREMLRKEKPDVVEKQTSPHHGDHWLRRITSGAVPCLAGRGCLWARQKSGGW